MNNLMVIRDNIPSLSEMKESFINFIGYKKVHNFSVTLRNYLLYLFSEKNLLQMDLDNGYSIEKKNTFIYNCAINTINEFFYNEKYYRNPEVMSKRLMDMFDTNFKLRDFEESEIDSNISADAKKMISLFENLKRELTPEEKKEVKIQARKLIASVD